ncbi:MAG: L-ribulose-5-phosphate 4-epimerase AraD [Deltaproteobacteria bacterium]|nr:L-ribulose-5-phosphate 4-epimerase AraD [Deltaproteobacteria bacterium]
MTGTLFTLKQQVCAANLELVASGLVLRTWGNASAVDRERRLVVIKPSGVAYDHMKPEHMVVVSLDTGKVVDGELNPSSDTATHLVLYRAFGAAGAIVHTHSFHATAWAQTGRSVPALGTTHADYFHGPIPCTRKMRPVEIKTEYEANTGQVIVECFARRDPMECPAVLVASHGPFTWGKTAAHAVENAVVLEYVVRLASETRALFPSVHPMQQVLMDKHFFRKHGAQATYGQKEKRK